MQTEITTMVMIEDGKGNVLVQNRVKNWCGYSFPGGHVEPGESFVDCAVREVFEETGLRVANLQSCGIIHWVQRKTKALYLVFLYKTSTFTGTLLPETEEGPNFWMDFAQLQQTPSTNNFNKYFPMFTGNGFSEAYAEWEDAHDWAFVFK